jgi:hypothetical protein
MHAPLFAPAKIYVAGAKHSPGVPVEKYYRYEYRQSSTAGIFVYNMCKISIKILRIKKLFCAAYMYKYA